MLACHSLYDAKSKRIAQTFSGGALIMLEADTEKTPSELRGGRRGLDMTSMRWLSQPPVNLANLIEVCC